jgi:hypothetical protein
MGSIISQWNVITELNAAKLDVPLPRWTPPIVGFKQHFDGSTRGNPGPSGIGDVVQDLEGSVMLSFKGPLSIADSSFTELWAMIECVNFAVSHDLVHLMVEGDSKNAIKWATSQQCPWRFVYLIRRVR